MAEGLERIRTQDEKENNEIRERINAVRGFCGKGSCAIVWKERQASGDVLAPV